MAMRPLYQPQEPHTRWGSLAEPQRVQVERAGADSDHAAARRLRVLALDFFFFGTAMLIPEQYRSDALAGRRARLTDDNGGRPRFILDAVRSYVPNAH